MESANGLKSYFPFNSPLFLLAFLSLSMLTKFINNKFSIPHECDI